MIRHADRIFALVENGLPYEMTPELATVGPCDFGGRLTTAMTAHPKEDPVTGELHFFGYGYFPPYLTYHRLSAGGELVESREIEVPKSTMMHDFAVTEHYLVWLDLPFVFEVGRAGGMPYAWEDGYGARIGVTPRQGGPTHWFDVDPCYVFHVGNAWEDADGRIVLNGARYHASAFTGCGHASATPGTRPGTRPRSAPRHCTGGRSTRRPARPRRRRGTTGASSSPRSPTRCSGRPSRYLYTVGETRTPSSSTTTRPARPRSGRPATTRARRCSWRRGGTGRGRGLAAVGGHHGRRLRAAGTRRQRPVGRGVGPAAPACAGRLPRDVAGGRPAPVSDGLR